MADGPLKFDQTVDGKQVLNVLTRFGRSFSIVRVPYAFKLMMQELQVMNVQMRLITDENIDQLMNLSYQSYNIDKLLHLEPGDVEISKIIEEYKNELRNKEIKAQAPYNQPPKEPNDPQIFTENDDNSPQYEPQYEGDELYIPNESEFDNENSIQYDPLEQQTEENQYNISKLLSSLIPQMGGTNMEQMGGTDMTQMGGNHENMLVDNFRHLPKEKQVELLQNSHMQQIEELNNMTERVSEPIITRVGGENSALENLKESGKLDVFFTPTITNLDNNVGGGDDIENIVSDDVGDVGSNIDKNVKVIKL